jgi:hypothetical protein
MPRTPVPNPDLIETIPPPEVVRERLSSTVRELQLLRQLLRLSERAARGRGRTGEKGPSASA